MVKIYLASIYFAVFIHARSQLPPPPVVDPVFLRPLSHFCSLPTTAIFFSFEFNVEVRENFMETISLCLLQRRKQNAHYVNKHMVTFEDVC